MPASQKSNPKTRLVANQVTCATYRLDRFGGRQCMRRIETQLEEAHIVETIIRRRRMERSKGAVAEQLFQAGALKDAVRAAERQRRAGDPGDRFADHVFCPVEGGGGFRGWPLGITEPSRTVGDQAGGF